MNKVLLALLCSLNLTAYSQAVEPKIEQKAINFFANHILPVEKHVRSFRYDGRIDKGYNNVESAIIESWFFTSCKHNENKARKEAGLPISEIDWIKKAAEWEKHLKSQPFDTTYNYSEVRLRVPKGLKKVKEFKYKKSRTGHYAYLWKRWKYSLLGSVNDVFLYKATEIDDIFLVTINTNVKHGSTGILYLIILDKEGNVIDWCRTTWIS